MTDKFEMLVKYFIIHQYITKILTLYITSFVTYNITFIASSLNLHYIKFYFSRIDILVHLHHAIFASASKSMTQVVV